MQPLKSKFLRIAEERGFIHQCTDLQKLDKHLVQNKTNAYIGFDCTAPSLHAGSLVPIMLLRLLQQCGHKPIILIGGGTTKIGDPSGKEETRQLINNEKIETNMIGIKSIFSKFLLFGNGPTDAVIVNNDEWLKDINYLSFLRDYGRHFSVNRMLNFDSVKLRLAREQPLSFLEFNYMIVQAYDFLELSRTMNCQLQMGGSDQWGNIINGIDLARKADNREIFGLTTPLLTTSSGAKMGKTADGAIWLNKDLLSPYDYWQYWRNIEDADTIRFLKLFTEIPIEKVHSFEQNFTKDVNQIKKLLATQMTQLCHGDQAAEDALRTAEKTFEQGKISLGLPQVDIAKSRLKTGIPAFQLFHEIGFVDSGSAGRKLIKNRGGKINDKLILDEKYLITLSDANEEGLIKISAGKKRHILIHIY